MNKKVLKAYEFSLSRVEQAKERSRQAVNSALDFGTLARMGFVLGCYGAQAHVRRIINEKDFIEILKNTAKITLLAPAGFAIGPTYLAYRGTFYALEKVNNRRFKKPSRLEQA